MAISGVVYSGKEVQVGISQEATFGTAIADAGAFVQIAEFDSVSIDYGLTLDLTPKNRGKRIAYDADVYASQTGGLRTITLSNVVFRKVEIAEFLYGVFQNVTEAAATPYMKTFSVSDSQPNFAANAGYFFTLGIKNVSNHDEKFTSCIVQELRLRADMVGGDGRLRGDVVIISGFAATTNAAFSGTWTINTQAYFDAHLFDTKTVLTKDVVLYNMEFVINNNAKRFGNNTSGNCQGYSIGVPELLLTGSVNIKYDAETVGFLASMLAGTEGVIEIGYDTATPTDGDIVFDFNEAQLTAVDHDDNREEGIARTINFKGVATAAATPEIRVCDALDQTW